jgi:hypothetical protein
MARVGGRRVWKHSFLGTAGVGNTIRIGFDLERGQVTAFTVQLECWIEGKWRPVVRYDTAHGRPHRDMLDWDGNVADKLWLAVDVNLNEALTVSEADLKTHANFFREQFLTRRSRP